MVAVVIPGIISIKCWMLRDLLVVQKISLIEIISTCSAATSYGCRSSGVFYAIDSATLQPVHRCTPAPYGILAVPAVLPTSLLVSRYWFIPFFLNVPINYQDHPMNPLPSIAFASSNIADCFTKPLSLSRHHRSLLAIGDNPITTSTTSVNTTPSVAATATVDSLATAVGHPTTASTSDSVPTLHPNLDPASTLQIVLDTGASFLLTPFKSDFLSGAPFGLIRSASNSVASDSKVYSKATTLSNDPHTLITGEDTATATDLSSTDSDSVATAIFDIREFGTATLVFISNSKLNTMLVEPTQIDWLQWVPLPRLTLTESYFHIFGHDYLQAFALFHVIPIWIALVFALLRSE